MEVHMNEQLMQLKFELGCKGIGPCFGFGNRYFTIYKPHGKLLLKFETGSLPTIKEEEKELICSKGNKIEVLEHYGYYIGTRDYDGSPYCRISQERYSTKEDAEEALMNMYFTFRHDCELCHGGNGCIINHFPSAPSTGIAPDSEI
jgi:hypothetical protein